MLYRYATLVAALLTWSANSQTLVDLRTQSKSVDFSGANSTKPLKSGAVLPATCSIGEMFFKTNAPAGSNLYACTALNAWTLQSGATTLAGDVTGAAAANVVTQLQGRSVSSSAPANGQALVWNSAPGNWIPQVVGLGIATAGTTQGTRPTLNFVSGAGITQSCADNAGSNRVDCTPAADTALLLTRATDQAATDILCTPAGGSTTVYTCNVTPALTSQAANGSHWIFTPDVNCGANPTLNINARGAVNLRKLSGGALVNLAANDCIAGTPYVVTKAASGFVLDTMTGGTGTVTSTGLSMPAEFSVSNSPVTTSGTLTVTKVNQNANLVYSGPSSGGGAAPTFRSLTGSDLPSPNSSTLGGVQSYAGVLHQWISAISTSGVPASTQPAAADLSNGTSGSGTVVLSTTPTLTNPSLGGASSAITWSIAHAGATGTSNNLLAKLTGAPSTAVKAATSDTSGILGVVVSGGGTSGSAQIAREGTALCTFDGGTTAGDYVQISSTVAGDCHDAGASLPTGGQVLGRVLSTNASAGTYSVALQPISQGVTVGGGGGSLTVQVGGTTVGTQATLNFASGNGITQSCTDNGGSGRVDCTPSFNSALVATHDTIHGNENYCNSTNGTAAYACALPNKALTGYAAGMAFTLRPDVTCSSSCTISIDGLSVISIKRADGVTDPQGTLVASQSQWIFYDGAVFRLFGSNPSTGMDSMTYGSTISLDVTAAGLHKTTTVNATGNTTINASSGGTAGQHISIIIVNDATSGKTITFGTNFRSAGTVAGTVSKAATVQFVSDGTSWFEVSRALIL
jgi:hypothetical protein